MLRRAIALGVLGLGLAVGIATLALARDAPGYGFAGSSPLAGGALLAAGWGLVGAGAASWLRRPESRFGPLLALAGFAWFAPEWNSPANGSAIAFTAGLVLAAACPALVGHAVLAYPSGRLPSRVDAAAVAVAYGGALGLLGLLPTVFFDPRATGCSACAANLIGIADAGGLRQDLIRAGTWLGVAWAVALALLAGRRLARHATRPVVAPAIVYLSVVAVVLALWLRDGFLADPTPEQRLWLVEAAALVGVASGVAWAWVRARLARSDVARLVVELAHSPPPGGLRDALAEIVGDPGLVLAYPLDGSGALVDGYGGPAELPPGREATRLVHHGRCVAVLAHRHGVLDDEQLVAEVAAAGRLALENERLQAEVRARVEELRGSRARIVAAGDAERQRLERDLHDGAQQRLVALSLSLRRARARSPASTELARAERELGSAIEELRRLAHGIFPAVLADDGLGPAVHALQEEAAGPVRLGDLPERRFDPSLEAAAYAVVAETVRAATGRVVVSARESDGVLAVELAALGADALDVVALEDRVGALDGRLDVLHAGDGTTTVRAELPCGS